MAMQILFDHVTPEPLSGVSLSGSEVWNTSLQIDTTQRNAILATSGKGKSTFIHLIYGLRQDYSGSIKLDQQDIKKLGPNQWSDLRQTRFSIIFQDLRLFPHLSALDNILLKANENRAMNRDILQNYAKRLGVEPLLNKKAQFLSYGERQRIAILRALSQPFDCLLLDEPFSHLDTANKEKAYELIEEVCKANAAGFIMTSLYFNESIAFDQRFAL